MWPASLQILVIKPKKHYVLFPWRCSPTRAMASSFLMRFLYHTQRRTTFCRTPLDEWSARLRDLWQNTTLTTDRHPCPPTGFEPTISAGEGPQTYALDRAATGTWRCTNLYSNLFLEWNSTCFGQFLCPSPGVFHCTHSKPVWHIPLLCVQWKTPEEL